MASGASRSRSRRRPRWWRPGRPRTTSGAGRGIGPGTSGWPRTTGTTTGTARQTLDASVKLDELPSTAAALRQGELSDEQATAVIDGIWHWTDPPDDSG